MHFTCFRLARATSICEYEALGQYSYNPETRILTLNKNTMEVSKIYQEVKNAKNVSKEPDILKKYYLEKMEIPNFTWITKTINWPMIRLMPPFPEASYEDLDFEMHRSDTVVSEALYLGKVEFERLCDYIKTLNSLSNFVKKIEVPMQYSDTTLFPDGSLKLISETHSWDRDGCYNWDSVVEITGKWSYDSEKRSITLTYETFNINENRTIHTPESHNLFSGISITTNEFYFESNFIMALDCSFYYSSPEFRFRWIRKK